MTKAVLLTGGNLGPVADTLEHARRLLIERVGPEIAHSRVRASEPWGFEAEQAFLNQVLVLETRLEPMELLDTVQRIERELGRVRGPEPAEPAAQQSGHPASSGIVIAQNPGITSSSPVRRYESRPVDIDILFYGDRIVHTPRLEIPHPLIARREFVLVPLAEVLPDYVHPLTGLSVREMLGRLG